MVGRPAKKTAKKATKRPGTRNLRLVAWVLLAGVIVLAVMPALGRWRWRLSERSDLGDAVKSVERHGCLACHRIADGRLRWRAYGEPPVSLTHVRDAVMEGRPMAPGFAGPMPGYGAESSRGTVDRLVLGAGAWVGLVASPNDPELQVGRDVAVEMGCFGCHGPAGAGGVPNLGSASGSIPGFLGEAFRETRQPPGTLFQVVKEGRHANGAWWSPWRSPVLAMPAYGGRLDSTELALLVSYLEWLADLDVTMRALGSYHEE